MVGWVGQFRELKSDKEKIINILKKEIEKEFCVSNEQILAWDDSIEFLKNNLDSQYDDLYLAMEYTLPRLNRKRPDIILFFEKEILVLEFKMKSFSKKSDVLQLVGYCENLKKYHKKTWENSYQVKGYLVLTKGTGKFVDNIFKIDIINKFENINISHNFMSKEEVKLWLNSEYEPLPNIITGAVQIFKNKRLAKIKSIEDSFLRITKEKVKDILDTNLSEKRLVLVAGVPGSGKTLLGLQLNYEYNEMNRKSIYLSGNGPLITILKKELENEALITGILTYTKEYSQNRIYPKEEIIIFDEAQRAWDKNKYGKVSEVEALLKIGNKIYQKKNKVTIVALIGFGQEIYKGEEKGIFLWIEELMKEKFKDWKLYSPLKLNQKLLRDNMYYMKELFLDISIRSDFIDITSFKNNLLKFEITDEIENQLKNDVEKLYQKGYQLYITRDLKKILKIVKFNKYKDIALISSSGVDEGIYQNIFKRNMKTFLKTDDEIYSWYKQRDESTIATEFVVQGLDIDYPIIIFGGDYVLKNKKWIITNFLKKDKKNIFKNKKTEILIRNIYNVLLTRGRKGAILFLDENIKLLDELYCFLKSIDILEL